MSKSLKWLCLTCVSILPSIILAQEWVARYNGPGNDWDETSAIAVDAAGNVYVTGWSVGSGPFEDYATVKYNAMGVEQWVARYNGPGNLLDLAYAIALDSSGNIYVTGTSYGSGTDNDYATVKYDSLGVEQWVARYNGPGNGDDGARAIAVDNVGYIYVTGSSYGSTSGDYATVKYDAMGVQQWVARYNGSVNFSDWALAIAIDNSDYIYVAGSQYGDYATVKYNAMGVQQWVATYNGLGKNWDVANAIAVDNAGNIYVTGYSHGIGTEYDYATVRYDSSGIEQWVARYNGPGDSTDWSRAIALDNAGNVYVTGYSEGSGTSSDYATVKYDSSGIEQWVARYDGPGNDWDGARAIAVDNAGYIYVTGSSYGMGTYYDYATVKYDSLGVEQSVVRYNGPGNDWDGGRAIAVDNAGYIYVTGYSYGIGTDRDYATIKYAPTGIEENKPIVKRGNETTTTIFSGPLQLPEGKRCKVFDITGRVVEPAKIRPGIYFIEVDGVMTQKVVKVK